VDRQFVWARLAMTTQLIPTKKRCRSFTRLV